MGGKGSMRVLKVCRIGSNEVLKLTRFQRTAGCSQLQIIRSFVYFLFLGPSRLHCPSRLQVQPPVLAVQQQSLP